MKRFLATAVAFLVAGALHAQTIIPGGGAGSGSGTVTSVATSGTCLVGGPITTTGTIALTTPLTAACGGSGVANTGALTWMGALTFTDTTGQSFALPSSSDTLVGLAATQTLTNKTLTSPTLTTPALGTPSALVLTNATGLVASTGTTATGTPSSTTYLRGDNTWATPAGGGSGCVVSGTAGQLVYNDGATNCLSSSSTITSGGAITDPAAGAASAPSLIFTGATYTGGSGTTTFPQLYVDPASTTSTTWSTSGTLIGANGASGFVGNVIDLQVNGASEFKVAASGAATLTSGLTIGITSAFQWNSRGVLSSPAAGQIQLGATDAASPVAQTLSAQSVAAGTSNTAGANLTITGSKSTGTGAGGSVIIQTSPAGSTGSSVNAGVTALTINSAQQSTFAGEVTASAAGAASTPGLLVSGAHYTGGSGTTTFPQSLVQDSTATPATNWSTTGTGIGANEHTGIGNLLDLKVDGTSEFKIGNDGSITAGNNITVTGNIVSTVGSFTAASGGGYTWAAGDTISQPNSSTIHLGAVDGAAPVAQTLGVQGVAAGYSNTAGANWTHVGSLSTGSGASGDIIFQTGGTGAGATVQNSAVTALVIKGATQNIRLPAITTDSGLTDTTVCQDTTNHALFSGSGTIGICLGTSSARFKHDINPLAPGLDAILRLHPISYYLNADHGDPTHLLYGFTAEQMQPVLPALVGLDAKGRPNTADYVGLIPVLVKAVQQQQAEIEALKAEVANDNEIIHANRIARN